MATTKKSTKRTATTRGFLTVSEALHAQIKALCEDRGWRMSDFAEATLRARIDRMTKKTKAK